MSRQSKEFFREIDEMLFDLLEMTDYYLSPYYKDQIKTFIDVGEEGLAFEALISPYYEGRHQMSEDAERIIKIISDKMEIPLPKMKT